MSKVSQSDAAAAGFSPFHFHRLFLSTVGETPRQFVLRLRVERSAALLVDQPESAVCLISPLGAVSPPPTTAVGSPAEEEN